VICEDHEAATFYNVAEMAYRRHDRQQLSVEGAVVNLGLVKLG
jgi:hypothetical protein